MLQLFRHVGRGHRWAAQIIRDRVGADLDPRLERNGKPPQRFDDAIAWLHDSALELIDAVTEAGSDSTVNTFLGPGPLDSDCGGDCTRPLCTEPTPNWQPDAACSYPPSWLPTESASG